MRFVFIVYPGNILTRRILQGGLADVFENNRLEVPRFGTLDFFQFDEEMPRVTVIKKKDHPLAGASERFFNPYFLDSAGFR